MPLKRLLVIEYLMDKLASVYSSDIEVQLSGLEYDSNDFLQSEIFCTPVEDGWYDISDLE